MVTIMTKQAYNSLHLSTQNKERLEQINSIIEEYCTQGYILTLRQLYYQLVSRGIIENKVAEYRNLSAILGKGRMAGIVDWDAIEDRTRSPMIPYSADNPRDAIHDIISQYRVDRMKDQDVYLECWIEKDALSGVLARSTRKFHINLMSNRGYSSISAMHDAALRMKYATLSNKRAIILYLGDHDPSGVDMVRDITQRMLDFNVEVEVKHLALLDDQIEKYNPPPNPAKLSDPRADGYIKKYGKTSWEVDALKPEVLNSLIENQIVSLIDINKFNENLEQEKRDIEQLKEIYYDLGDE